MNEIWCPLYPFLFSIVLDFLARAARHEAEITEYKLERKMLKYLYF
jgi:hypothetical protein